MDLEREITVTLKSPLTRRLKGGKYRSRQQYRNAVTLKSPLTRRLKGGTKKPVRSFLYVTLKSPLTRRLKVNIELPPLLPPDVTLKSPLTRRLKGAFPGMSLALLISYIEISAY